MWLRQCLLLGKSAENIIEAFTLRSKKKKVHTKRRKEIIKIRKEFNKKENKSYSCEKKFKKWEIKPDLSNSIYNELQKLRVSLIAQLVQNPPAMQDTLVQFLGWEDPMEKGKATHSSNLAWRITWTIQFMGLQRVRQD